MKFYLFPLYLSILFSIYSCGGAAGKHSIHFNNTKSVESFPASIQLGNGTPIETESLGNLAIRIIDTLMIVSTDAEKEKWWIYSLPDMKVKTKLLNFGSGPMEFTHIPICDHVAISQRDGHIKASVHNALRGRYFDVDLSESIRQNQMVAQDCPRDFLDSRVILFYEIAPSEFFCLTVDPQNNKFVRKIYAHEATKESKNIARLNSYQVKSANELNVLSAFFAFNPSLRRVAEIPAKMRQINIYSIDDNFAKTITPDGKLDDYNQILETKGANGEGIYKGATAFADYFGVIVKTAGENGTDDYKLRFFDWDGFPIVEVAVSNTVLDFDIDFVNKQIYTLDYLEDEIRRYDATELIGILQRHK